MSVSNPFIRSDHPARECPAPTVLIACTTGWDFPAFTAIAFARLGWRVEAVCGRGQRLSHARAVRRVHRYRAIRPLPALHAAIARAAPDLVVPCDDRAHRHLLALQDRYRATGRHAQAALLARSLGEREPGAVPLSRTDLIALAEQEGVRAPPMLRVAALADLPAALERVGLPAVLKVDGTWGGSGVAVAGTSAQMTEIFTRMSRRLTLAQAIKRLLIDRDPYWLESWYSGAGPEISVQRFVAGKPANCAVACQAGEVLAIIQVAVERTQREMGPSAIVRVIDDADIAEAARRIVRRLRLSGFIGLDFIMDAAGAPHLIEMNQRMTPTGHLALGPQRDPVGAMTAHQAGRADRPRPAATANDLIALFPAAWRGEPDRRLLDQAYHDIPWDDPALVQELTRPPWRQRGWLARLYARLKRQDAAPSHDAVVARIRAGAFVPTSPRAPSPASPIDSVPRMQRMG